MAERSTAGGPPIVQNVRSWNGTVRRLRGDVSNPERASSFNPLVRTRCIPRAARLRHDVVRPLRRTSPAPLSTSDVLQNKEPAHGIQQATDDAKQQILTFIGPSPTARLPAVGEPRSARGGPQLPPPPNRHLNTLQRIGYLRAIHQARAIAGALRPHLGRVRTRRVPLSIVRMVATCRRHRRAGAENR